MNRTVLVTLVDTGCSECHIAFSVPKDFWDNGWSYGGNIFCPRGHRMNFGVSRAQRLEEEGVRLRAQLDQAQAAAEHQRNRANGMKGALTKTQRRVSKGVCPCCTRTFADLAKHMDAKHPDYGDAS